MYNITCIWNFVISLKKTEIFGLLDLINLAHKLSMQQKVLGRWRNEFSEKRFYNEIRVLRIFGRTTH